MNKALLEYEIKKNGMNVATFCERLGISKTAFYRKTSGKTDFKLGEIKQIADILHLESVIPIFFAS